MTPVEPPLMDPGELRALSDEESPLTWLGTGGGGMKPATGDGDAAEALPAKEVLRGLAPLT